MVDATRALLAERPVERITVRDVAERAGHHHRFVAAWFGGKAGLLMAVVDQLVRDMPPPGQPLAESGRLGSGAVQAVHVLNWLVANHPEVFDDRSETPLIDKLADAYRAEGVDADHARSLAQLIALSTAGFVVFGRALGVAPDDVRRLHELQTRMVAMLAAERSPGGG